MLYIERCFVILIYIYQEGRIPLNIIQCEQHKSQITGISDLFTVIHLTFLVILDLHSSQSCIVVSHFVNKDVEECCDGGSQSVEGQ